MAGRALVTGASGFIGGRLATALAYGEMLDRMAVVLGVRRRPRVPVPLITPWLSSLWIGLVTPVDAGVARPLIEGLAVPTVVTDRSGMELFDVQPIGFDQALRRAVAEIPRSRARRWMAQVWAPPIDVPGARCDDRPNRRGGGSYDGGWGVHG
jgi:uncharacterized protein YbjT (DUF2867 family)